MANLRWDLLRWRPVSKVVSSHLFPLILQVMVLGSVLMVAFWGWGEGVGMSPEQLDLFRKTNLATLLVWGLWWPAMIVVMVSMGRWWCTVCPLELVNRIADALARRLGWPRLGLGRFLSSGWLMLGGYVVLQLLILGAGLHHVPHHTALLIIALLGAAFLSGLLFRHPRSFCRAFCPAGAVLSAYGRHTAMQLEVRDNEVCRACETKDCIQPSKRYRFDARSCPSLLRPFDRTASDGCLVCFQCAKVCPHDNVGWGLTAPEAPIRRHLLLKPFEAGFVFLAAGFLLHETTEDVAWMDRFFTALPRALAPANLPWHWFEGAWYLFIFPVLAWGIVMLALRLFGHSGLWGRTFRAAATGAVPLVATAHVAKALSKIGGWAGFFPLALRDPSGHAALDAISLGRQAAPGPVFGFRFVGWAMLPVFLLVALWAWRWIGSLPAEDRQPARGGWLLAVILFGWVLVSWSVGIERM